MAEPTQEYIKNEIFEFYKRNRPEYFSDTMVKYEVVLTQELFDTQLATLSTQKKQSDFEKFVLRIASRLITPNVKNQTGPDGGGDGKIDGETYVVSEDISNKWFIADESHNGNGKWAIAISCKKDWKPKVKSDVKKILEEGRGYTRILFFTNQLVKGKVRVDMEQQLKNELHVDVDIFDGYWCKDAVFNHNCLDIALETLGFSDEYKRKNIIIGPNDKVRQQRLDEIEKKILRKVSGLDTDYVEDLRESCIISRELERPRTETEGRFHRAIRECDNHGTSQQKYHIIYDYAWTSFFWFRDIDITYKLYLELKGSILDNCNVTMLEKFLNIFTNLTNAYKIGLLDKTVINEEETFVYSLEQILSEKGLPSSVLYLKIYLGAYSIITKSIGKETIAEVIRNIKPLLIQSINHIDISFNSLYELFSQINDNIDDCKEFDILIDDLAETLAKSDSVISAANLHYIRANKHIEKDNWVDAIKHLGFCIRAYDREEYRTEMIKSSGMMGIALSNIDLPFSALTFFVKSAAMLFKKIHEDGEIQHLLITVLQEICDTELRLGRLAMFLVWHELLKITSCNSGFWQEKNYIEKDCMYDACWACRLSIMDTTEPLLANLPDIFKRHDFFISPNYLTYTLGYPAQTDEKFITNFAQNGNIREQLQKHKVFDELLSDICLSKPGTTQISTTISNCVIEISYDNIWSNQIAAESFLAMIEVALSTIGKQEAIFISPKLNVKIINASGRSFLYPVDNTNYELSLNSPDWDEDELFNVFTHFLGYLFSKRTLVNKNADLLEQKQEKENWIIRVSSILQYKTFIRNTLGDNVKYRVEDWINKQDTVYNLLHEGQSAIKKNFDNNKQKDCDLYTVNQDMSLWEQAGWHGCSFIYDQWKEKPLIFGLIFKNIEAGQKIVCEWKEKPIIIYIIRGIDEKHPSYYRVAIVPDIDLETKYQKRYASVLHRSHTMTPDNTKNLDMFENTYKKYGFCYIKAFQISDDNQIILPKSFEDAYKFAKIIIKNAWEISMSDKAMIGLFSFDKPYIPEGHKNDAPVIKALEMRKKIQNSANLNI